jgi:hypothetical protein
MNVANDITSNLELEAPRPSYLPSRDEVAAASPDQRAILYAESLVRAKALGETVDPARVAAAVGLLSELAARHAPRLLAKAPAIADEIKAGRRKLPTAGNAWHFLCERGAKEAAKASEPPAQTSPTGDSEATSHSTHSDKTSPIGEESANPEVKLEVLEKVSEPEPQEQDRARFEELKRVVHAGLDTFLEVGRALAEIRARKLYRLAGFRVFDDFLRSEFNLSRTHSYRAMDAVASVEDLATIPGVPAPTNVEQVRPLAGLTSEEKKEVWTEATATAPEGKPPTGAHVKKTRVALGKGKPKAATKPKATATTTSTSDNSSGNGESATTVPGQAARLISLEGHLNLAADALAQWKRTSLGSLREAARGRERLVGVLDRVERYTDESVEWLRGCARAIAS